MILMTPVIAILVVFRISYGWKANKVTRMHQPGRFFKGYEMLVFMKKNIKFIKRIITTLLSIMCCTEISFLLFYFVCPWKAFTFQSSLERVFSV
jgi:hypothetical protein